MSCPTCGTWPRGEMSVVGPRPTLKGQVDAYTPRQRGRLAVKPGITGWAQVNGRASLPWPERIELDLWYVEHRSLALDLEILRRTVRSVSAAAACTRERRADGSLRSSRSRPDHRRRQALRARVGIRAGWRRDSRRSQPAGAQEVRRAHRRSVPRFDDPAYVPALRELCDEFGVGAVVPLTDLDLEILGHARTTGQLPAFSPTATSPAPPSTSTRPTCCLSASRCPRRRRCCPAWRLMATPSWSTTLGLRCAVDLPRRRRGRGRVPGRLHPRAGDDPARDAGPGVLHGLYV